MKRVRSALSGALVALAAMGGGGCVPQAPKTPDVVVQPPAAFSDMKGTAPTPDGARDVARVPWEEFFGDPQLTALLRFAIEHNPDVPIALQRVEMARTYVKAATGAQLPQVGLATGAGIRKFGLYTMDGAGNATTEITPNQLVPVHLPEFSVGLVASWEVDVWGKLSNQKRSAAAQYLASVEATQWVVSLLVSQVANAYFELLAAEASRNVLTESLARQEQALEVVRLQKRTGMTTELAVQQFVQEVIDRRAHLANTEQRIVMAENQLNLLLGRYPRTIARSHEQLFSETTAPLSVGVPADLLRNRPDVRQAELQLQATKCDVAAARAAFYPDLTLTAGVGLQAFNPKYLLDVPSSLAYNASAGLLTPLVNRAAIEADFDFASARQSEALFNYQKVVLNAYFEVVNGLSSLKTAQHTLELKTQQKIATDKAIEVSDALFLAGKATYFEVLMAQQNQLSAELERVHAAQAARAASVDIYRALGGGAPR